MRVGFAVIHREGHVEFHFYGPSPGAPSSLVTFCRAGDLAAAFMGRLYYRQELLSELTARLAEDLARRCAGNDAALALAVYRQLGPEGLARLEGDYALALWDGQRQLLLGSRDPLGGYPLFWTQAGGCCALGTRLRPLVDLGPQPSLDPAYLAEFLMLPGCSVEELPGARCPYEGIHRVLPGSWVRMDVRAGGAEHRVYWNWLERLVDPGSERLEEISGRYRDLLRTAVEQRLHGRTAAHFSGGMDSTSVALLARDCVSAGGGQASVHTLSLVYEKLAGLAREQSFLGCALDQQPGIVAHRVLADGVLDFDSFVDAPLHDEPSPWLWRSAMERLLVEAAATVGASTILSGEGADELLNVPPLYLGDLLRRGRLWSAWRQASRWARAVNCSVWSILGPFAIANLLPAWTRAGLGPLWRGGYASWENQNDYTIPPWILPAFARRHGLRNIALGHIRRILFAHPSRTLSHCLVAITSRQGDFNRWYLAAPHGMAITHPFLDPRLLCFSLGIAPQVKSIPGRQKPVLAEAMRDVLPEAIRSRQRKGHFNEVYFHGLSRHRERLTQLIREAPVEELGFLDKNILRQCLEQAALGLARDVSTTDRLNLTLSLLQWLSMQQQWRRAAEPPSDIVCLPGPALTRIEPQRHRGTEKTRDRVSS